MALDKLVDSAQLDSDLASVANAIRAKSGGTGQLAFPAGFVSEIGNISGGTTPTGTKEITITQNGTTTEDVADYANAEITVTVQSSGLQPSDLNKRSNVSGAIVLPEATLSYAAYAATAITSVSAPNATSFASLTFGGGAHKGVTFAQCRQLETAYLPMITEISDNAFDTCTSLTTVYAPNAATFGSNAFRACAFATVVFPAAGKTWNGVYQSNTKLVTADLGTTEFVQSTFNGCTKFNTLILRSTTVVKLGHANNFTNTPFASNGSGGTLYVPSALISAYEAATNWSTILGYANNQILPIEGSIYETQYADGTPIPTT